MGRVGTPFRAPLSVIGATPLRVILGPTAAGKSALALAIAEREGGAIISADSRQLYRGFDIGTAKPDSDERTRVPHYGVDVADPAERYSAARWAAGARQWMDDAMGRGLVPIVVGGTGFYVRALTHPLAPVPPMDEDRRRRLDAVIGSWDGDELRRWVTALDPDRAHLGSAQLRRALETALLTGHRLGDLHRSAPVRPSLAARYLVVMPGVAELRERIERRVDAMFAAGWLAEVRALMTHVPEEAPAWKASGYEAVRQLAQGRITCESARESVIVATRQYAKRQRTWLRHQLAGEDVTVVDPAQPDHEQRAAEWFIGTSGGSDAHATDAAESNHGPGSGTPRPGNPNFPEPVL